MTKNKEVPYCEHCKYFIRLHMADHQCDHEKSMMDDPPIARNFRTCKEMRFSDLCGFEGKYFERYDDSFDFIVPMNDVNWPEDADLEEEREKILGKENNK